MRTTILRIVPAPFRAYSSSSVLRHAREHIPRTLSAKPQALRHTPRASYRYRGHHIESSYTPYTIAFVVACGTAVTFEYFRQSNESEPADRTSPTACPPLIEELPSVPDERMPDYASMATPSGTLGNLTPEQEAKLREFWLLLLKTFGTVDELRPNGITAEPAPMPAPTEPETPKKSKRRSLFSRGKHEDDAPGSPASSASATDDDKYGQTAELQRILKDTPPEALRDTCWEMMKADHPDSLLLRFLRARKWDVNKALAMLISTMNWRREEKVDEDIMFNGELHAVEDSKSSDSAVKKEADDFLVQLRMGKSFLHGADKEGRPITYVKARLHKGGAQTEKSMERLIISVIETARLTLKPPVETGCIIFDMTGFSLANMDYTPIKFMIKAFEANYPECLGAVLVHKAPWVFQGIWKIIKGWLDPVVAAKVHFTNSIQDMEAFIPKNHVVKELDGGEDWEYQYVEPVPGENDLQKDSETRQKIRAEREADVKEYAELTLRWIEAANSKPEYDKIHSQRDNLASKMHDSYWRLDPYIRARTLYDRVGMLNRGDKVDYYPKHTLKRDNVNGSVGPPRVEASADDVD